MHRQDPLAYTRCSANRRAWRAHPDASSAFAFSDAAAKVEAWRAAAGGMPYWPPPLAGSQHDLTQNPLSKERPQHAIEVVSPQYGSARGGAPVLASGIRAWITRCVAHPLSGFWSGQDDVGWCF